VNKDEATDTANPGTGFRISEQPVVGEKRAAALRNGPSPPRWPSADLLYVVARDPKSLFLYWDLNWTRLFDRAGISARQVHLRTYRGDGTVESTQEINPFRGHCFAEVSAAGTEYYCELGGFEGSEWKSLVRSSRTTTPEASMSDDFATDFAALPTHLSFQRLLDILRMTELDHATLACSVAKLQANARERQSKMAPGDPSQLAREIVAQLNGASDIGMDGAMTAELSELVEAALRSTTPGAPTAEELARWKELGQRYGGSSWGGASKSGFGASSPP